MAINEKFVKFMLPHAIKAIGKQHGWLISWAIAKAGQETGWNVENVLVREAKNCLGIKGGYRDEKTGKWITFPGVAVFWKQDSLADGRDDGLVAWRKFASLADCFGEFVRMLNDRDPYQVFRNASIVTFENIYADRTPKHSESVLNNAHEVTEALKQAGLADSKGRIK